MLGRACRWDHKCGLLIFIVFLACFLLLPAPAWAVGADTQRVLLTFTRNGVEQRDVQVAPGTTYDFDSGTSFSASVWKTGGTTPYDYSVVTPTGSVLSRKGTTASYWLFGGLTTQGQWFARVDTGSWITWGMTAKTPAQAHTISGTVRDGNNALLADVSVAVSGASSSSRITGANGFYEFTGLVTGNYTVTPSRSGYVCSPLSHNYQQLTSNVLSANFTCITNLPPPPPPPPDPPVTSTITTVSSANYRAPVAPDSLVSTFGTNLADATVQAQLDANGNLPTVLAGTSVTVNKRPAGLLFVSAFQVNYLLPVDTELGAASVEIRNSELGTYATGTVDVTETAPGVFTLDASGTGEGAVLNAVTYRTGPFRVTTHESAGNDKRTRLSIFATGIRFAGANRPGVSPANVSQAIAVTARDSDGEIHLLPVEYCGPAPGFFGLDQINVVLSSELDGMGISEITVREDANASNLFTVTIRESEDPVIESISPIRLSPGQTLTIAGRSFSGSDISRRAEVWFDSGRGYPVPGVIQNSSNGTLHVTMPPLPGENPNDWHVGEAKVCLKVDGVETCFDQRIQVTPALAAC